MEAKDQEGLTPLSRARSNTWPVEENYNIIHAIQGPRLTSSQVPHSTFYVPPPPEPTSTAPGPSSATTTTIPAKKTSSRRNAWGNLSYAEMISQAIQSAPEKRLTLSQIYEWMVQNIGYFNDKGDTNSSAGWKNSIRHNLSLHNRFMRVQNEGTGKSSWWMINPDAKPGKSARRRAASMETSKFEKRRGRARKKVEAMRNGVDTTPSPSSSVSEGVDQFPESPITTLPFNLSPVELRPRASSNASSCGRLSPIRSHEADSQVAWSPQANGNAVKYDGGYNTEQLADMTGAMKLSSEWAQPQQSLVQQPLIPQHHIQQSSYQAPPPPYDYAQHYGGCPIHIHQICTCNTYIKKEMDTYYYPQPAMSTPYVQPHLEVPNVEEAVAPQSNLMSSDFLSMDTSDNQMSSMMSHLMGALNSNDQAIMLDAVTIDSAGFGVSVEDVLNHEIKMEGNVEFNYPMLHVPMHQNQQLEVPPQPNHPPVSTGHSWVH